MLQIDWNPSEKTLRQFGPIALVGFGLLAAVCAWRVPVPGLAVALLAIGVATCVLSFVYRPAVRYVYVGMSLVGYPIGMVVSFVLMAVLYFGLITPIGWVLRLCGYDPLERALAPRAETYWKPRRNRTDPASYFGQF